MKKIIATVLAMVMALALCTTAFAASKYVLYDEDKKSTDIMVTKTDASSKNKTTLYYTYVDENDATHYLVPADKSNYDGYVEGNYVKEVNADEDTIDNFISYADGKLVKMTAKSGEKVERNCTTSVFDTDVYFDKDNAAFVKVEDGTGTYNMLYNGVILSVDDVTGEIAEGSHLWIKGDKVDDGIYNVKCASCGATAVAYETLKLAGTKTVVKYDQAKGIATANDMEKNWEGDLLDSDWYVTTSASTDTKTDGNKSPKTFDAGIAMYVGMALTSVAGSAVVIGKKKEF
ncbi:MAG: hypothetical protein U0O27_08450 [Oscillospiraceae bacterium]